MGLSAEFLNRHISEWEERLGQGFYAHRRKWPSRLFHHCPLQTAAQILSTGELLSRDDSEGKRPLDVAEPEIVHNRLRAHKFARLYFRPRTPTQFHIEGVRKPHEYYRGTAHAPTLTMLVFDARIILAHPDVRFSRANMQSHYTPDGDTEEFFTSIEFDKVYHEGGIDGDYSIISSRCAEVLASSPMPVADCLQWVYCRSHAERATLLHLMGRHSRRWEKQILVSDDIRVFEKKYTFVEEVSIDSKEVLLALSPRLDLGDVAVKLRATRVGSRVASINYGPHNLKPFPPYQKKRWRFNAELGPGTYKVTVDLEGCRAYEAQLFLEDEPF